MDNMILKMSMAVCKLIFDTHAIQTFVSDNINAETLR